MRNETTDRSRELAPRLCAVGNALEELRDTTFHQGALWSELDRVLARLDAVLESLGTTRHAGEETPGEDAP